MSTLQDIARVEATRPNGATATSWRAVMAVNALVAGMALTVKLVESATTSDARFTTVSGRVANELCYFTIQSNLIVVAVCTLLAWRPDRWRWLAGGPRLVGLVCITVTGVVYYTLLAADEHFTGVAWLADLLAHAVSPILFVGTWLFLGPRSGLRSRHVAHLLVFVFLWIALTLGRGAITRVYPYDFVDVSVHGYSTVIITLVSLTAAALGLAVGAVRLDRCRALRVQREPQLHHGDRPQRAAAGNP